MASVEPKKGEKVFGLEHRLHSFWMCCDSVRHTPPTVKFVHRREPAVIFNVTTSRRYFGSDVTTVPNMSK